MAARSRLLRLAGGAGIGVGAYAAWQATHKDEVPVDVRWKGERKTRAEREENQCSRVTSPAHTPPLSHSHTLPPTQIVRMELREKPPSRADMWASLRRGSSPSDPFDVLVVGGGATGTGCAVDAVTR